MAAESSRTLPGKILSRIECEKGKVWTQSDFVDLGSHGSVDKALQRMSGKGGRLRRVARGMYFLSGRNKAAGKEAAPSLEAVVDAAARRVQARWIYDGPAAAHLAGLTTTAPTKTVVLVDARLRPVRTENLQIEFRKAAPRRLYWAGRPGMCLVQGLHWLHGVMDNVTKAKRIRRTVRRLLKDAERGAELAEDLKSGLTTMPAWMRDYLRDMIAAAEEGMRK